MAVLISHLDGGQLLSRLLLEFKYLPWLCEESLLFEVSISNGLIFFPVTYLRSFVNLPFPAGWLVSLKIVLSKFIKFSVIFGYLNRLISVKRS